MNNRNPLILLGIFLSMFSVILIILLFTSQKNASPPIPAPTPPAPPTNTLFPEPLVTRVQSKLIEQFPEVPIYPGSIIQYSYIKEAQTAPGYEALWTTNDNIDMVTSWYENQLRLSGWSIIEPAEKTDSFEKYIFAITDNLRMYVTVETSETETEIYVEMTTKKFN